MTMNRTLLALVFLAIVLLAGCGLPPDFTSHGIDVHVTRGLRFDREEIELTIGKILELGRARDPEARGRPRELHLHRGFLDDEEGGLSCGGYYDSLLNAVHIARLDYVDCLAQGPWGHEWAHWQQDASGRSVGHALPYFGPMNWSGILQFQLEGSLCD